MWSSKDNEHDKRLGQHHRTTPVRAKNEYVLDTFLTDVTNMKHIYRIKPEHKTNIDEHYPAKCHTAMIQSFDIYSRWQTCLGLCLAEQINFRWHLFEHR